MATEGVTFATISFYPEITGTGQILTDLALALSKDGLSVRVFTAQPHYYSKHEKLPDRENYRGIEIFRIPSTTFNKNNRLGRIFNWASFAFSALLRLLFDRNSDPLLIVSSPPVLPFAGWILKRLKGKSYILLLHDIYPEIGVKLGFFKPGGLTVRIWNWLNKKAFASASKVIVLASDMASKIHDRYGNENGKVKVIHNWADGSFIRPIAKRDSLFLKDKPLSYRLLIQYAGNLGFNHDLEPLVEAAKALSSLDIGFLFIGEGGKKEKLQALTRRYQLKNVHFFPFVPREILPHSLGASDLSVVTLEEALEGLAVPSKFYSILASGKAVLGILSPNCEMAEIIEKNRCGFVTPHHDSKALINVLKRCYDEPELLEEMGRNARACFEKNFTRERAASKYKEIILETQGNARLIAKG